MSAHSTRVAKVSCAAIAGTLRRQPSSQWFGVRSQSQKAVASSPSTCRESWTLGRMYYARMMCTYMHLYEKCNKWGASRMMCTCMRSVFNMTLLE